MPGMRCDQCNELRLYWRDVVVLRAEGGSLRATLEMEDTPERELPAREGRYHVECYAAARELDDRLPGLDAWGVA
jgi:hypothetical protein